MKRKKEKKKKEMSFDLEIQATKTLTKMLIDRGYKILPESKDDFSIKGISEKNKIMCFICNENKLSIKGIKECMSIMNKEDYNRCIIVYRDSATASAKKSLENMDIELFSIHELQFDVTQHRLVPLHEKVTKEEKELLDKNFKGKLPFILQSDPISRYYFFQRSEYVRITRKDGTVMYRIVK